MLPLPPLPPQLLLPLLLPRPPRHDSSPLPSYYYYNCTCPATTTPPPLPSYYSSPLLLLLLLHLPRHCYSHTKHHSLTFAPLRYVTEDPAVGALRAEIAAMEADLATARNALVLSYKDPATGATVEASSVGLRNTMSNHKNEATRKAAYEALCGIGPFVLAHGFCDIVKKRNQVAKLLGYVDYYDYKVCAPPPPHPLHPSPDVTTPPPR